MVLDASGTAAASLAFVNSLPLQLDYNTAFCPATIDESSFHPKHLEPTAQNLNFELPPGDYEIPVTMYCTRDSLHVAGPGVGYAFAYMQGKAADAIAILYLRGAVQNVPWIKLQGISWSIQAAIPVGRMSLEYQQLISPKLIPEYEDSLKGDFLNDTFQPLYDDVVTRFAPEHVPTLRSSREITQESSGLRSKMLRNPAIRLLLMSLNQNVCRECWSTKIQFSQMRSLRGVKFVRIQEFLHDSWLLRDTTAKISLQFRYFPSDGNSSEQPPHVKQSISPAGASTSLSDMQSGQNPAKGVTLLEVIYGSQVSLSPGALLPKKVQALMAYPDKAEQHKLMPSSPIVSPNPAMPITPDDDCSKQIQAVTFTACAHCVGNNNAVMHTYDGPQVIPRVEGNRLWLETIQKRHDFGFSWYSKFQAIVHIKAGAIPIDNIHLRFCEQLSRVQRL